MYFIGIIVNVNKKVMQALFVIEYVNTIMVKM